MTPTKGTPQLIETARWARGVGQFQFSRPSESSPLPWVRACWRRIPRSSQMAPKYLVPKWSPNGWEHGHQLEGSKWTPNPNGHKTPELRNAPEIILLMPFGGLLEDLGPLSWTQLALAKSAIACRPINR